MLTEFCDDDCDANKGIFSSGTYVYCAPVMTIPLGDAKTLAKHSLLFIMKKRQNYF